MAITKVINDAVNLNQTSDYSGLKLPVGTTEQQGLTFNVDYLIAAGGGGGGMAYSASTIGTGGGGGAGGGGRRRATLAEAAAEAQVEQ